MPTKYNPLDFENELEYVEAELGYKLEEYDYELNDEGKLLELVIKEKGIFFIDFVANLISLIELNLNSNQIQDIQALSQLTSLRILYLDSNQIKDIKALSKLTSLTKLFKHLGLIY
ncbi:MAG: leucine-rich repeat domain-containing protein [Bacteroidota bacterium]